MAGQVPQVPPPDLLEPLGVKVVSALGSPGQETVTTRVLRRSCRRRRRAVTRARTLCSARTTSWPRTRPCCPRPPRPAPPRPPPSTSPPSTPRGGRTAAWAGRGRACSSARSLWRPHRPTPGGDRLVANIFIYIFDNYQSYQRQRTLSTNAAISTEREPIIRAPKRTIYTQGRPPWYDSQGQQVEPFVIGICGGSASGKTTVANKIISELDVPWVTLLSMDSFYKVLNERQHEAAAVNEVRTERES